MLTDKQILHDFGIQHCEDEGSWMLVCQPAGDDEDE